MYNKQGPKAKGIDRDKLIKTLNGKTGQIDTKTNRETNSQRKKEYCQQIQKERNYSDKQLISKPNRQTERKN